MATPCALAGLRLQFEVPHTLWCPEEPGPLQAQAELDGQACALVQLLERPCCLGLLRPSVRVACPDGSTLELPVGLRSTLDSVARDVAARWGVDNVLVEAAHAEPPQCPGRVLGGDRLEATRLLRLAVHVRTACCGEGAPGVRVAVDAVEKGLTDAAGCLRTGVHRGRRDVALLGCPGQPPEPSALAVELVEEQADGPGASLAHHIKATLFVYRLPEAPPDTLDATVAAALEGLTNYSVWVCAEPHHIPEGALPLQGALVFERPRGGQRRAKVRGGAPETPVQLKVEAPPAGEALGRCPLTGLRLEGVQVPDLQYFPEEPSPLAVRAGAWGGCELRRLLQCPVALGLLRPAVLVHCPGETRIQAAVEDYPTVADVVRRVAWELSLGTVLLRMELQVGGVAVADTTLTARLIGQPSLSAVFLE